MLPGVSAMHGAAALAGAPLGHDFCAISLSDLLTPWAVIEQRLRAAADGDFVVALYNPASNRRRRGLARAIEILAAKRTPATPVVVARAVGRDDQSVTVTCLRDLDQSSVDMMTLLIVGSSETRVTDGRVYTPRGYRAKRGSGEGTERAATVSSPGELERPVDMRTPLDPPGRPGRHDVRTPRGGIVEGGDVAGAWRCGDRASTEAE